MGKCNFCESSSELISDILQICRECILNKNWDNIKNYLHEIHAKIRELEGLPIKPPKNPINKIKHRCDLCINECLLGENGISYCGLRNIRKDKEGTLPMPNKSCGYMHGYIDPNPTNCCSAWFCPAGTLNGYPKYSNFQSPEYGTYSYAAFLYGCTFSCLFCQNASHKHFSRKKLISAKTIVEEIINNKKITCICFFGGTPEAQLPFAINISEKLIEKLSSEPIDRKMRICYEWNGSGNRDLAEKCMNIAIKTGGNIKFDLKSFNERLNIALCGVSNIRTLENFKYLAEKYFETREKDMPELNACTLLVPGYVNKEEVELIAKFIAKINSKIPYSLLIFHGDYMMKDLPITPKDQALQCLDIAKKYLDNVHLGNKFLLNWN